MFALFSSTMSKSPVLPLFANHLGATESIIGLIAAASTIVGIVSSLPAGALSDMLGRRKVMMIAAVVFATAPFLYLLVTNAWQLVVVRIYHGFATAIFGPVAMALIADLYVKRRGENMGWYSSATMVGRTAAPFVGGFLITLFAASAFWHFRMVYVVCGVAGCVALVLVFRLPKEKTEEKRAGESTPQKEARFQKMLSGLSTVVRHRGILVTSVVEAIQFFGYGAFEVFLPIYAVKVVGIRSSLIGILLGVQVLALTLSKPLMGHISDRYGRSTQIIVGLAFGALALGLISFFHSFWILLILSLLIGLGMSSVTASTSALVADLATGAYGSALGVMGTIKDIGHSLGPIAAGFLIAAYDYRIGYFCVGGLLLLAAILFPFTIKKHMAATKS
jgi:MFS family permease